MSLLTPSVVLPLQSLRAYVGAATAAAFSQTVQSFVAKQTAQQNDSPEADTQDSDTDVDIDGEGAVPALGMQDLKGLNSKLTKLAMTHSINLVPQSQLVSLLSSFDSVLQQGESTLIGSSAKVS